MPSRTTDAELEQPPKAVRASWALVMFDAKGGQHFVAGVSLEGSPDMPGSMETLPPGDVARIRADGYLNVAPVAANRLMSGGAVVVRAAFAMQGVAAGWSRALFSENAVPVSLQFAK